ncbi:MAG: ornithine cyclodeaminase family protein [Xanthomonadales bacterium]|nr:ornithine cyclodeaminase family protein [Xanthomonadales bacterium]
MTRELAFDAVRDAFESVAMNRSEVFDVVIGSGLRDNEIFGVKSGTDIKNRMVGLKVGTYWGGNAEKGLPAHGSTILLLDPDTGVPQVLVSASYLNGYRTAAADAVAVSFLARSDAAVLGVIGAGHQAEHEIRAVAEVRNLSLIKVFTRSETRASWLADRLADIAIEIQFTGAEAAVRGSDIVVTATPSKQPLVRDEWVSEGTHISAMGADTQGKHELDTAIMKRASLFAEYPQQSIRIGEFQHAYGEGLIDSAASVCALGLVTLGHSPGRTSDAELTVFDSSGIAIQDLAMAAAVYEAATQKGLVQFIEL